MVKGLYLGKRDFSFTTEKGQSFSGSSIFLASLDKEGENLIPVMVFDRYRGVQKFPTLDCQIPPGLSPLDDCYFLIDHRGKVVDIKKV